MARKRIITPERKSLSEISFLSTTSLEQRICRKHWRICSEIRYKICWKQSWMNISDMKSTNQLKKRNQITVTGNIKNIKVKCRASRNRYPAGPECRIRAENCSQYKRDISEIENKIIAMYARGCLPEKSTSRYRKSTDLKYLPRW